MTTLWAYEIHIVGEVDGEALSEVLSEFGGVTATTEPERTMISGTVADQAALLGVLDRLQALGLQLCDLRRLGDREAGTQSWVAHHVPGPRS